MPRLQFFVLLALLCLSQHLWAQTKQQDATSQYRKALSEKTANPAESCQTFKDLMSLQGFSLQEEAYLRAREICSQNEKPAQRKLEKTYFQSFQFEIEAPLLMTTDAAEFLDLLEQNVGKLSNPRALNWFTQSEPHFLKNKDLPVRNRWLELRSKRFPRFQKNPEPEHRLRVARDLAEARNFAEARKLIAQVLKKPENLDEALAARRLRRQIAKNSNLTDKFIQHFQADVQWAKQQGLHDEAEDLRLGWARALWTAKRKGEAQKVLIPLRSSKRSNLQKELAFVEGKMAEEDREFKKAFAIYSRISALDLTNAQDLRLQFAKFWSAYQSELWEKALDELTPLEKLEETNLSESVRARFWKARILKRIGKTETANELLRVVRKLDPLGYYGMLTYFELGDPLPPLTPQAQLQRWPDQMDPILKLGEELWKAGDHELLRLFMISAQPNSEKSIPALKTMALAQVYLPLFASIPTFEPAARAQILEKDPELLFPLDQAELVLRESKKRGVPAALVFSIIRQESAFFPEARSPADAFGLMQILPSVAQRVARDLKMKRPTDEELYLPEVNIPLGTELLRQQLKKFRNPPFAIASYNAAESSVRSWIKTRWQGDAIDFIEQIPFEETRSYVKLIIRNWVFYDRLLNPGQARSFPTEVLGAEK